MDRVGRELRSARKSKNGGNPTGPWGELKLKLIYPAIREGKCVRGTKREVRGTQRYIHCWGLEKFGAVKRFSSGLIKKAQVVKKSGGFGLSKTMGACGAQYCGN